MRKLTPHKLGNCASADRKHRCLGAGPLDVAKVTCGQFATYKITNPQFIAIWLNGYYHGVRGDTVIDTQKLGADTKAVQDYCIKNSHAQLMEAVEATLAPVN